jgi:hypothetical protein
MSVRVGSSPTPIARNKKVMSMKPFIEGFKKLEGYAWVYKLAWKVESVEWTDSGAFDIFIIAEGTSYRFNLHLFHNKLFVWDKDALNVCSYDLSKENYSTRDRFITKIKEVLKPYIDKTTGL